MTTPPPLPRPRGGSYTGYRVAIILLIAALAVSLLLNFSLTAGRAMRKATARLPVRRTGVDEQSELREIHSLGRGSVKAARIPVNGVILRRVEGGLFSPGVDMTESILSQIRAATDDRDVRAILIEVDSPGGAVTPIDEIHRALRAFRESRPDRRIVVHVRDIAASGGYYIAVAADRVVAEPTAVVGSIGVMIQTLNWHDLSARIGIRDATIKSGENKDLLNPFREIDPAQQAMLQSIVDQMHERFVRRVSEGRNLDPAELAPLADGRIFTAADALRAGLIDHEGSFKDALALLREMLDLPELRVVRYESPARFGHWLSRLQSPVDVGLFSAPRTPRFAYLWQP